MLKGCENLSKKGKPVRVIWAIKNGEAAIPEGYDEGKHWVAKWLPQVELLAHPAVKFGVTHCGFGGTTEFVVNNKPALLFPHFGD